MRFKHRFTVSAPLFAVAAFHRQSRSMAAITPPPAVVRIHRAPQLLDEGDEMDFTIWMGPLPIRWKARIEQVSPQGFSDRQLQGPFKEWVHQHSFHPVDAQTTEIGDEIEGRLRIHPLWSLVGLGIWLSLPFMFAYRAWKTRRIIQES